MRRLLATTIATICLFAIAPHPAAAAAVDDEAGLVAGINAVRTSRGLQPLEVHPDLALKAQAWAAQMAGTGILAHSPLTEGITADWASLAENVATGDTLPQIHQTLLDSPVHFANIVDPELSHIGVGLASAGGRIYLAEEFMRLRPPTVAATPSTTTAPPVAAIPPTTTAPPVAATPSTTTPHPLEAPGAQSPTPVAPPPAATASVSLPEPEVPSLPLPVAFPAPPITPVTHRTTPPAPLGAQSSQAGSAWLSVGLLLFVTGNLVNRARPARRQA